MFHGGGGMEDILGAMFGGGMGGMSGMGRRPAKRKGRDTGIAFPVTLEDLYCGKTTSVPHEKTILCTKCKGSGSSKPGANTTCTTCRGQGMRMVVRQMGPMIQQMQVACDNCRGTGVCIDPKDKCKACNGKRTEVVNSPLKVVVEPGMSNQDQIPFRDEGDITPDIDIPGNIVVVLQQVKHERFVRNDNDLMIKQTLSLADAICGFQFVIEHLDGRKLVVRGEPGEMIKPGDKKCIKGEGMPIRRRSASHRHGNPNDYGNLIVQFEVEFPERLQTSQVEQLAEVLPAGTVPPEVPEDAEEVYVTKQPLEQIRRELDEEDDDDEDAQRGGSGMQCQTH